MQKYPAFQDLENLDAGLQQVLTSAGFRTMTEIQAKTWEASVSGKDVVGLARAGTGKTIAFLLPSIQRILDADSEHSRKNKIRVLIVSPTRELANRIADKAQLFVGDKGISSQVLLGGIHKRQHIEKFETEIPLLLTATPGRLLDLLDSGIVHGKPFREYVNEVQILVLDEMDRLLDMGFEGNIRQVVALLPEEKQTLLFSATLPSEVKQMVDSTIKPDYTMVDCVTEKNSSAQTSHNIKQSYVVLPNDRMVLGTAQVILNLMQIPKHKVLVFFPTTSQVAYFSNLFNLGFGRRVLDCHSKKNKKARAVTSELFQYAREAVMFTSDVSARDVDYPDFTHVVQIGAAIDRETYIHRLGRTGRDNKKGEGILVLLEAEKTFLANDLEGIDIPVNFGLSELLKRPPPLDLEGDMMRVANEMRKGENPELVESAEELYSSLFGFYNMRLAALGVPTKEILVEIVNAMAAQAGLHKLPVLSEELVKRSGVTSHSSLKVASRWSVGQGFDVGKGGGNDQNSNTIPHILWPSDDK